jgi:hypothetical protein
MMPEISLNLLDVAENSVRANASCIEILVDIRPKEDSLVIQIEDDGCGMTQEQVAQVQDPFFTTRTTRKVGLGVPFLKQACESTGGSFVIHSEVLKGTKVVATFGLSHIDRMPLGDLNATIYSLVVFHEGIRICYTYRYDGREFTLDTAQLREVLGDDIPFSNAEVSQFIKEYLSTNQEQVDGGIRI